MQDYRSRSLLKMENSSNKRGKVLGLKQSKKFNKEEILEKCATRSFIWQHFKKFNYKVKDKDGNVKIVKKVDCQIENCNKSYSFSSSTTRCHSHLKNKHKVS